MNHLAGFLNGFDNSPRDQVVTEFASKYPQFRQVTPEAFGEQPNTLTAYESPLSLTHVDLLWSPDGRMTTFRIRPGGPAPSPTRSRFWTTLEDCRQIAAGINTLLSLSLLVLSLVWVGRRIQIADACSAVAILSAATSVAGGLMRANDLCTLALAVVFLALSLTIRSAEAMRAKNADPHLCKTCGYNLTGNVSGVCPECGTTVPEEQRAAYSKQV